ncbi:heat shock protein Hsp20 [Natrialba chahannaoensis JCM 10990]|uniref:Heat shock protein Hsp20 n=1 Tax=Natrialba chahannaoensis JCM 10990 TaxID=1227492 RepID=M0ASK7_9EURY|nr:Hsp20/alpha crystallin family protein [Natrialba chahannaoensis]ELZ01317.1 heat shock protein Hsp20 [Natrialba chahannaoensis JCM 10990]
MPALRDALRDLTEDVFFDLLESNDSYLLVLDVPGITADSLNCVVEDGQLVITAQREKDTPDGYQYLEENRSLLVDIELPLPNDIQTTMIETDAVVERGVLEITLPKETTEETTIDIVDEIGADGETDTDTDTDTDADTNAKTDTGSDFETAPDTDTDTSTDADADTDADTSTDADEPR